MSNRSIVGYKPSLPVLIGGGVAGTAVILGIGVVLIQVLNVMVTLTTIIALGVVLVAFYIMFPLIIRSLMMARRVMDKKLTEANPVLALEENLVVFRRDIEERRAKVQQAAGELEVVKRTFSEHEKNLSEEKKIEWLTKINTRAQAVKKAEDHIRKYIKEYEEYKLIVAGARAEVAMADADNSMARALSATGENIEFSAKTTDALNAVSLRVGAASKAMEMSLSELDSVESA